MLDRLASIVFTHIVAVDNFTFHHRLNRQETGATLGEQNEGNREEVKTRVDGDELYFVGAWNVVPHIFVPHSPQTESSHSSLSMPMDPVTSARGQIT